MAIFGDLMNRQLPAIEALSIIGVHGPIAIEVSSFARTEDGRVAEEGSHAELLRENGLYARFWARQSGGFIGLDEAAE